MGRSKTLPYHASVQDSADLKTKLRRKKAQKTQK
jgi:hypothetical protein